MPNCSGSPMMVMILVLFKMRLPRGIQRAHPFAHIMVSGLAISHLSPLNFRHVPTAPTRTLWRPLSRYLARRLARGHLCRQQRPRGLAGHTGPMLRAIQLGDARLVPDVQSLPPHHRDRGCQSLYTGTRHHANSMVDTITMPSPLPSDNWIALSQRVNFPVGTSCRSICRSRRSNPCIEH